MSDEDLEPLRKSDATITVGEDLSPFSIAELTIRVQALEQEIERVKSHQQEKGTQASLAENLFKSGG